jgi:hypothetical protein
MWEIFNLPATVFLFAFSLVAWGSLAYGIYAALAHVVKKYELF